MQLKTFRHLAGRRAVPSNYAVASTGLLYHASIDPAVKTPALSWIEDAKRQTALIAADLDDFEDPRKLTYTAYVRHQRTQETVVSGVLSALSEAQYAANLPPKWRSLRGSLAATLRFPCHALQMAIAYIGGMVPGSRVCIACSLQAADEVRRIDHFAYLTRLAELEGEQFAAQSRLSWQSDALWQPLRRLVETLLVTYAWDEALAALMLTVKPVFDTLVFELWSSAALANRDVLFKAMLDVLAQDAAWHAQWSTALFRLLVAQHPENASLLRSWADKWRPLAVDALEPLGALLAAAVDGRQDLMAPLQRALQERDRAIFQA